MEQSPAIKAKLSIQASQLLSSLSSHPLFSILTTSSLLVLLYLPRPLLPLLFSPVLLSTILLLTTLLRFGSTPKPQVESHSPPPTTNPTAIPPEPTSEIELGISGFHQKTIFSNHFIEWGRRGCPLEVIYEEYEGDEHEEENGESPRCAKLDFPGLERLGLLSTDTETESGGSPAAEGWDSPENRCFRWEDEEEDDDELIEIALEEDNLIEIDISGYR
ncbi:uncharacterized protein [Typha latifolia]|uniref:uncharacterized protein n=1 Tax=Typha latifolia TaxID=4733 RepID=UPI003C2E80B9